MASRMTCAIPIVRLPSRREAYMHPFGLLATMSFACLIIGCQTQSTEVNPSEVDAREEGFAPADQPTQGGAAKSSDQGSETPGSGLSPAVQQWFACQCGGPCEGAEPPLVNIRPSCHPRQGRRTDGQYEPCGGLFCGLPCAEIDPGSDPQSPSSTLCNSEGECVPAGEAVCIL